MKSTLATIEVSKSDRFGKRYSFITEELLNMIFSDNELLVRLTTTYNCNIPLEYSAYLDELELVMMEDIVRVIESTELYSIVRTIQCNYFVVPTELVHEI